ncbi:hypothetical protein UK23_04310 [Lentzea aerocolonigenes]|uniref:Secreted protein n=2 Tax=Lentzea aerocolonigenes TaxID=68170 RepID=A0A0F0H9J9_LENAE|nr:hypothetical protein UK23_04310 [Lentzea aerocolonigenes]
MWAAGVAAAAVVSGAVLVTAGPASAASCNAPEFKSCLGVSYRTTHVQSIRVDGRCVIGGSGTVSNVHVDDVADAHPNLQTYGGGRCESNTHNSASVSWALTEDDQGFRWVTIS